jgi:hypothetical protein
MTDGNGKRHGKNQGREDGTGSVTLAAQRSPNGTVIPAKAGIQWLNLDSGSRPE